MNRRVLIVDDDPNILSSFKRQLRKDFNLDTALGGGSGIENITTYGPYAVVVADMQMPGMDGIEFLMKVKEISPETVRMMLTGNADQKTAVKSINEGNIFRFMNKPCSPEELSKTIEAGIEQYRLITAEKELLKNTLTGTIRVLADILSLVSPSAFSRASRIKKYVKDISEDLHVKDKWKFELSALLSQIGCVTVPSEILNKVASQNELSDEEEKIYRTYPLVGYDLISKIPRLQDIAEIIKGQLPGSEEKEIADDSSSTITMGRQFLQASLFFDQLYLSGLDTTQMRIKWREKSNEFGGSIVGSLEKHIQEQKSLHIRSIHSDQLQIGMITQEDIMSKEGILLFAQGQEVTYPVIIKIRNFAIHKNLREPFKVQVVS